ncbi:sensor histidine kinase [Pseudoxanthomonas composti]|uniref:histidine kinase n=1 Tax=Pseudoxanthomonas composti TaxID=2137479 RepID=A0A4Q1JSG0_9GAMM|nr:HAMP domain-containing sensor histidine kinase [Pseudoxanthomonas composti]RXR02077.1 HAMP domain-containing histidine kinase [Pseudoxanthomonas composti]
MTNKPRRRRGLRLQVTSWLVLYAALLSLAVFLHGYIVNEQAEQVTWRSLLESELQHFLQRSREDARYRWTDTDTVQLFGDDDQSPVPAAYQGLGPGIYDGVRTPQGDKVVLVRDVDGRRLVLALDITELQGHEDNLGLWMLASNVLAVVLLGLLVAWGMGRVIRPLSELAERIRALRPDRAGQSLPLDPRASAEQGVIAEALNDYLARNDRFVERERAFVNSVSHELRTPIAVIGGAAELGLDDNATPTQMRTQLTRIRQTAGSVEHLITSLLVLAKDPARTRGSSEDVELDVLLRQLVADHAHLAVGKDLQVMLDLAAGVRVLAPPVIVQVVVGNLLRNAIEHSDRGVIHVALSAQGQVRIADPGHGMTPEEVSAIYARMARGASRDGGGIGLELIAKLCGHLGWTLSFLPANGGGTVATLDLCTQPKEAG